MRTAVTLTVATTISVFAAGCGASGSASPTATPQASTYAVDITLSGALAARLVAAHPVACAAGVGNAGQPLLRLDMSGLAADPSPGPSLGIDIVGYHSAGAYNASAVWAADGATAVTIDSDPSRPVAAERFVATSGNVTVTSAGEASDTGTLSATLVPETPRSTADVVHVSGHWSCALS